jgi:transcription-repair coupling factor (superfamily II helicase)
MKKTKSPVMNHQIFERYHKFNIKNGYSKKQNITLKN